MDEMKVPFIHVEVVRYLEKLYSAEELIYKTNKVSSSDQRLGIMIGSLDVINTLKTIVENQEGSR